MLNKAGIKTIFYILLECEGNNIVNTVCRQDSHYDQQQLNKK